MSEAAFWELIEASKRNSGGSHRRQLELVRQELANRLIEEVVECHETMAALMRRSFTWELWGAAYVIRGSLSDDDFDNFRAGLIMQGEQIFDNALIDPDSLADAHEFDDCEALLSVFNDVHEERTGGRSLYEKTGASFCGEPLSVPFDENEAELEKRYPRLFAQYWKISVD